MRADTRRRSRSPLRGCSQADRQRRPASPSRPPGGRPRRAQGCRLSAIGFRIPRHRTPAASLLQGSHRAAFLPAPVRSAAGPAESSRSLCVSEPATMGNVAARVLAARRNARTVAATAAANTRIGSYPGPPVMRRLTEKMQRINDSIPRVGQRIRAPMRSAAVPEDSLFFGFSSGWFAIPSTFTPPRGCVRESFEAQQGTNGTRLPLNCSFTPAYKCRRRGPDGVMPKYIAVPTI